MISHRIYFALDLEIYIQGNNEPIPKQSIIHKRSILYGNCLGFNYLAKTLYERGTGIDDVEDYKKEMFQLFEKSMNPDLALLLITWGSCMRMDLRRENIEKSLEMYHKAIEMGNTEADRSGVSKKKF